MTEMKCKPGWLFLSWIMITILGVSGCMAIRNIAGMSESDYAETMRSYAQSTYNREFEIVDSWFPGKGYNTGMEQNLVVLQEKETGILVNITAQQSEPMVFYDNYIQAYGSYLLRDTVDCSGIDGCAQHKFYVTLRDTKSREPNLSADNISMARLIINIQAHPTQDHLQQLYQVYQELDAAGYSRISLYVGFTGTADIFEQYVLNFPRYGVLHWEDYDGEVYGTLMVREREMSFDSFCEKLTMS